MLGYFNTHQYIMLVNLKNKLTYRYLKIESSCLYCRCLGTFLFPLSPSTPFPLLNRKKYNPYMTLTDCQEMCFLNYKTFIEFRFKCDRCCIAFYN